MKKEIRGHPIDMATGPPLFQACAKVVKQPVRIEIMENEMAKLENPDQVRASSCLYPSEASLRSSSKELYLFSWCLDSGVWAMVQITQKENTKFQADKISRNHWVFIFMCRRVQ
jgi:hypothetical protein